MPQSSNFLRRDPADVTPWAETCGEIRCLIEEKDGAAGEVHRVKIQDAKMHYHAKTDEFNYAKLSSSAACPPTFWTKSSTNCPR